MNEQERRASISDLADGRLRGQAFADAVTAVSSDADARASWHAYHLIGDVLRSGELAGGARDQAFVRRLSVRLQAESVARPAPVAASAPVQVVPAAVVARQAANAPQVRWRMLALAASVAAVAAIGWNVLGSGAVAPNQPQLAALPAQAPLASMAAVPVAPAVVQAAVAAPPVAVPGSEPPSVMIRDPRLDELLAAHKQAGGASALQMPAGFLRNATFEGQAR